MIAFIKNNEVYTIRKKLILLYILNVTDIIFTIVLLKTGYFREMNIFMVKAVQNPMLSFIIKIIFPAILLRYLYKQIYLADKEQLQAANIGILISLAMYSLVNISHLVWTALLPVFHLYL
ncbi:MAG: hypothetical protein GX321_10230 [Clostridiales bacterium]|nr:hypothetical protein [Clostridiales bacterium]